jgi:hypothetical protein
MEQIAESRTLPQIAMHINNRELWFEDALLTASEPILADYIDL